MLSLILTGISLFIATNIDDLILLIMFFALYHLPKKRKEIVIGQYIGMGTLITISVVISYTIGKLELFELKWLGFIPIILGVKTFFEREEGAEALAEKGKSLVGQVLILTLLNGTDNIAVYVSLFSPLNFNDMGLVIIVFLVMTAIWCFLAMNLVRHEKVRAKMIQYKRFIVPVVLIYVGINMLLG